MKRVTGLGGIFFKASNPEQLTSWYEQHLGVPRDPAAGVTFPWKSSDGKDGMTIWSPFARESQYFAREWMINYRVDDLDALLVQLAAEGVDIDPKREDHEYGRFAWITDPEGNRIELWEPPKEK